MNIKKKRKIKFPGALYHSVGPLKYNGRSLGEIINENVLDVLCRLSYCTSPEKKALSTFSRFTAVQAEK